MVRRGFISEDTPRTGLYYITPCAGGPHHTIIEEHLNPGFPNFCILSGDGDDGELTFPNWWQNWLIWELVHPLTSAK